MARLAVGSLDPVVYAIALEACKGSLAADAAACKLLSRTQWARLDADSALPWLELAAEASRQQAFDAEAEAMQHAAMARRIDAHAGALPELVERALSQAHTYCGADAVADRERRPICGAMAEMLVSRDENTGLNERQVQVARKNLRLLVDNEARAGTPALHVARVRKTAAGLPELDPRFGRRAELVLGLLAPSRRAGSKAARTPV